MAKHPAFMASSYCSTVGKQHVEGLFWSFSAILTNMTSWQERFLYECVHASLQDLSIKSEHIPRPSTYILPTIWPGVHMNSSICPLGIVQPVSTEYRFPWGLRAVTGCECE